MGLNIQSKLRQALGSVKDHASVGKAIIYTCDGKGFSDIEIAVVRATSHDNSPIDDKHVHEILFLVSNTPGSIPFLAERISRRLGKTRDPLVALKTLLLIHRLLRAGNCCFEQQLSISHASGHLQISCSWFLHNSDPFFAFLQKYAAYLEERIGWIINQSGKLEPVMSGGLKFRCYKEKSTDLMFRALPRCQDFIDKVLNCSPFDTLPSSDDPLVQAAISNTLKESFQVYMTYSDGVAALINMFFDLSRPARVLACDMLKKASRQSQHLHNLYEKCRGCIENKSLEYPTVDAISMNHVMALEQCAIPASSISKTPTKPPSTTFDCPTLTTSNACESFGNSLTSTTASLFSCPMETTINKVWVIFDDEDHKEPHEPKGIFK